MVEKTEGQKQLTSPTIAGSRQAQTRRAEVDDRLAFKGGITGGQEQKRQNGAAVLATEEQPLKTGSRGTIINIRA